MATSLQLLAQNPPRRQRRGPTGLSGHGDSPFLVSDVTGQPLPRHGQHLSAYGLGAYGDDRSFAPVAFSRGLNAVQLGTYEEQRLQNWVDVGLGHLAELGLDLRGDPKALWLTATDTLQTGASGAEVASLQDFLTGAGLLPADGGGDTSGDFGSATAEAVMQLQAQLGVSASGIVDSATRSAVVSALVATSSPGAPPETAPLRTGRPPPVPQVQARLPVGGAGLAPPVTPSVAPTPSVTPPAPAVATPSAAAPAQAAPLSTSVKVGLGVLGVLVLGGIVYAVAK